MASQELLRFTDWVRENGVRVRSSEVTVIDLYSLGYLSDADIGRLLEILELTDDQLPWLHRQDLTNTWLRTFHMLASVSNPKQGRG